jgi:hypothetical protein
MAEVLHLSPRDVDQLTVEEFDQAVAYVKREARR